MNNKKAISPVVAIALLLVVSVVAVVGFQQWYGGYQSGLFTDTEQRSNSASGGINIEFVSSDGVIYITNTGTQNVSMDTIKIGDVDCSINQNLIPGVNNISVASCLEENDISEVKIITDNGVFQEEIFTGDYVDNSLSCSNLVGGEWVLVPGDQQLGTNDFCVMKYEAKCIGKVDGTTCIENTDIVISQANNSPWTDINQTNANLECQKLGSNYHLINNVEWTTIARNIENNSINWNSSIVGVGTLSRGWAANLIYGTTWTNTIVAPYTNSSCLYNTAANTCGSSGEHEYKRNAVLSNEEIIWDLAGNIWEFTNDNCLMTNWDIPTWTQWTHPSLADTEKSLAGPNGIYDNTYGIGQYFGCTADNKAFIRGGYWGDGERSGIYFLALSAWGSFDDVYLGFRCTYTP